MSALGVHYDSGKNTVVSNSGMFNYFCLFYPISYHICYMTSDINVCKEVNVVPGKEGVSQMVGHMNDLMKELGPGSVDAAPYDWRLVSTLSPLTFFSCLPFSLLFVFLC